MTTVVAHYTAAAVTNRGRKRPSNEDAFGYSIEDGVFVVCDGMGGAAAGEIASSLAVDEALRLLGDRGSDASTPLEAAVAQAISAANAAIHSRAQRNAKLSGMGTTLVGLAVVERRVLVFNVGDSRCYRLRNSSVNGNQTEADNPEEKNPEQRNPAHKKLEQISLDHSLVEEQVREGSMTPDQAHHSPLRNIITRALGTQNYVTPDLFELEAEPGDLFLLCTDGLTGELTDAAIEALLAADFPLEELCANLVKAANKAGGHDNITCLLMRAATESVASALSS